MKEMRFIVDKENGLVICIGVKCSLDCVKTISRNIPMVNIKYNTSLYNQLLLSDTFKGIAKLHPNDEWDEEIGRQIAKEKMLSKYRNAKIKKLKYFNKEVRQHMLKIYNIIALYSE